MYELNLETVAELDAAGEAMHSIVWTELDAGTSKEQIAETLVANFTVIPIELDGELQVLPMNEEYAARLVSYVEILWRKNRRRKGINQVVRGFLGIPIVGGGIYAIGWLSETFVFEGAGHIAFVAMKGAFVAMIGIVLSCLWMVIKGSFLATDLSRNGQIRVWVVTAIIVIAALVILNVFIYR